MPIAYISPYLNETNDYIELVKSIVRDCGYEVRPLSLRTLASSHVRGLFDRRNVILVHWLETRAFSHDARGAKLRPNGLLQFLIYFAVLMCSRARRIYFVHDHAVHDLTGWRRTLSVRLIQMLCWLADARVVHDPSFQTRYRAQYLPHPLYREDLALTNARPSTRKPPFKAGILGAIRPYKCIEQIAPSWPDGWQLLIRGRCEPRYEAELRELINQSVNGAHINLHVGFMNRDTFNEAIAGLDALVLPHADSSALVSGAFFEAIGNVPVVIARKSPFTTWAQEQFRGVLTFETVAELADQLQRARQLLQDPEFNGAEIANHARNLFAHEACVRQYGAQLGPVSPH